MGFIDVVMFNPVIVSKHDMYETEEGCLSLDEMCIRDRLYVDGYKPTDIEHLFISIQSFNSAKLSQWTSKD